MVQAEKGSPVRLSESSDMHELLSLVRLMYLYISASLLKMIMLCVRIL